MSRLDKMLQDETGVSNALCRRLLRWIDEGSKRVKQTADCASITFRFHEVQQDEDDLGGDTQFHDYIVVTVEESNQEEIEGRL